MKVVILAGGLGTRISEETGIKPKPMIDIGGFPIIIHLMRFFYRRGFNEFIICGGYKCELIKEYFWKYNILNSDFSIDNKNDNNKLILEHDTSEKWKVSIFDTGIETQTAGRLKVIKKYIGDEFIMTYGDGLSDVNLQDLIETHEANGGLITLTSVQNHNKFGMLSLNGDQISEFVEKPVTESGWINAGFMIVKKEVLEYIEHDSDSFEFDILPKIAKLGKLYTHKHKGFWKCMDTLKDKNEFEQMIKENKMPWKK